MAIDRRAQALVPVALAALVLALGELPAQAQSLRLVPQLQATVTATDNADFALGVPARKDVMLDLSARLQFQRRGPGLNLDGNLGLDALAYARESRLNHVLPNGRLDWQGTLVERWLYLDGGATVAQVADNPLGARPDSTSAVNRATVATLHLAPALRHEFSPTAALLARWDNAWTKRRGDYGDADPRRSYQVRDGVLRWEVKPVPLGYTVEASRNSTLYASDDHAALDDLAIRGRLISQVLPELQLGLVVGREHSEFSLASRTSNIGGARLLYTPSERTDLQLEAERRYFGTGWDASLRHRTPFWTTSARWVRRPTAEPTSVLLAGRGSTADLLDAMLTTRYPDAAARAGAVQTLMQQLNLPASLSGPVTLTSDVARLEQGLDLSLGFLGRLGTVTVSAFWRHAVPLRHDRTDVSPLPEDATTTQQRGLALDGTRRLGPLTVANLRLSWSDVRSSTAVASQRSETRALQAGITQQLSPRSNLVVGARHQWIRVQDALNTSTRELAGFVGLGYRF
jgi:uncharacterized protein (PEP-CTERM system associated)